MQVEEYHLLWPLVKVKEKQLTFYRYDIWSREKLEIRPVIRNTYPCAGVTVGHVFNSNELYGVEEPWYWCWAGIRHREILADTKEHS